MRCGRQVTVQIMAKGLDLTLIKQTIKVRVAVQQMQYYRNGKQSTVDSIELLRTRAV